MKIQYCLIKNVRKTSPSLVKSLPKRTSYQRPLPRAILFQKTSKNRAKTAPKSLQNQKNQIESHKIKDLPNNIIVLAKTSQLSQTVSKGLEGIRYKYSNNLPSNITSIKNFKRGKDEDLNFLTYGSSAKNLYLILLENL